MKHIISIADGTIILVKWNEIQQRKCTPPETGWDIIDWRHKRLCEILSVNVTLFC